MPEGRERGGRYMWRKRSPETVGTNYKSKRGGREKKKKGEHPSLPTSPILRYLHKQLLFPTVWEEEGRGTMMLALSLPFFHPTARAAAAAEAQYKIPVQQSSGAAAYFPEKKGRRKGV